MKISGLEVEVFGQKAVEYVSSPEGRASLLEALGNAREDIRALQEARKVDWHKLHEPVDI